MILLVFLSYMFQFCNQLTFFHVSTNVLIWQDITIMIPLVTYSQKPNPFLGWFHCAWRNVEASDSMHEIIPPRHFVTLKLVKQTKKFWTSHYNLSSSGIWSCIALKPSVLLFDKCSNSGKIPTTMSLHDNMRTIVWTCQHEGSPKAVPSWKISTMKPLCKTLQVN